MTISSEVVWFLRDLEMAEKKARDIVGYEISERTKIDQEKEWCWFTQYDRHN